MDAILDDLEAIAERCERVAEQFEIAPLSPMIQRLIDASQEVERSASQSWLGYQSTLYLAGFKPASGGECFDSEWGGLGGRTRGEWVPVEYDDVKNEILRRAGVCDLTPLDEAADSAEDVFNRSHSELLPLIDALISTVDDSALREAKTTLGKLTSHSSPQDFGHHLRPKGDCMTRDTRAIAGGVRPPHHLFFRCWVYSRRSYGSHARELANIARHVRGC